MTLELLAPLVALALVDSTSFGTLVLPVWLLLAPGRLRAGRVLLFLGTLAACYLVLGLGLAAGAVTVLDEVGTALDSRPARVLQVVVGVALMVLGLTITPLTKAGRAERAAARAARRAERGPGRLTRWRERATGDGPVGTVVLLAVAAVLVEAASMLPYLAAIAVLTASALALPEIALVLTGYCLVMVLPALLLLGARAALRERITPALRAVERWTTRNADEALAWVLFLLGVWLTSAASS